MSVSPPYLTVGMMYFLFIHPFLNTRVTIISAKQAQSYSQRTKVNDSSMFEIVGQKSLFFLPACLPNNHSVFRQCKGCYECFGDSTMPLFLQLLSILILISGEINQKTNKIKDNASHSPRSGVFSQCFLALDTFYHGTCSTHHHDTLCCGKT